MPQLHSENDLLQRVQLEERISSLTRYKARLTEKLERLKAGESERDALIPRLTREPPANAGQMDWSDRLDDSRTLPITDPETRMAMAGLMLPNILIQDWAALFQPGTGWQIYSFTICSNYLFKVSLQLVIDVETDALLEIRWPSAPLQYPELSLLSPAYADIIRDDYIPCRKINLIVYGLDDMANVMQERILAFYKIVQKYRAFLTDESHFSVVTRRAAEQDRDAIYTFLRQVQEIDFNFDDGYTAQRVSLRWDIVPDGVLGTSMLRIVLRPTSTGNARLEELSTVFQPLMRQYGVVEAVSAIFRNAFGISGE